MNKSMDLLCAHSGLLYAILLGAGMLVVTGWLPPLSPALSASDVQQIFIENTFSIRLGLVIGCVGAVLVMPFAAAIYSQMRRMEGDGATLSVLQVVAASGGVFVVLVPAYIWLGLAYRPASIPLGTLQVLNDISWLMFVGAFSPAFIQNLAIGFCILQNRTGVQAYPRWVGYANLWLAVTYLPGALLPFFKSGPFTWAGLIGFWVVAVAFFGWILMMWWMTVCAVRSENS